MSCKQKIGSTSSTDAELIAMKDCVKYVVWIRNILREINIDTLKPTIIYQDNKSAIIVCTQDRQQYKRIKHMITIIGYIRSLIEQDHINIEYQSTTNMVADLLTKSLPHSVHSHHTINMGIKNFDNLLNYTNM